MLRDDLNPKSKCYECKGCYKLQDPKFEGLIQCGQFERKEQRVWCADETVDKFLRTRKV